MDGVLATEKPSESKALRLARYLREFVGLRSTTIYDANKYESVLWFHDMPQEPECQSPAWNDGFEEGASWLVVRKQQFPKPPAPPEIILPWIDEQALKRATDGMPGLRPTRLEPDLSAGVEDGEDPPLVERRLDEYPDVAIAYERYRPNWEAWSAEYKRRNRIQTLYAELFRLYTQVQKQGEIVEAVLGLGLLSWRSPGGVESVSIFRHVFTARVDIQFDPATGVIYVECAADGARLRVEDDMLDVELRPERGAYESVKVQLNEISDAVWDRQRIFAALKSWAAVHPDSEWLPDLKPTVADGAKPVVSFAPALIMRKRTQTGMVRIYEALIERLSPGLEVPAGWAALVNDEDDQEGTQSRSISGEEGERPSSVAEDVYFPLAANREQRRIVEAIRERRGVLVQGPPGTGKSHTIANLVCHLLASGQRVLVTAETARALKVLKEKLPADIQPLCVSLLGQGGDSFAELNSAVQGITTRFATWTPGAYDQWIAEVDKELDRFRRSLAKIDSELRSLREDETCPHQLVNSSYTGTPSVIAARVARERNQFDWLQLPSDAADDPPVSWEGMERWLQIRRIYDDEHIKDSNLQVVGVDKLIDPIRFSALVGAEREARENVDRIASLKNHPAFCAILALNADRRTKLAEMLRDVLERKRRLLRLRYQWLNAALADALEGRQARWQALFDQSRRLIEQIEVTLNAIDSRAVLLPKTKDIRAVRADASVAIEHLKTGGKWTAYGLLTPKAVKDRTYLREQVTVDGMPADTHERLQIVCHHVDLQLAFNDLDLAWSDHAPLPASAQHVIRAAAIKEQISTLGSALEYARVCLAFGSDLSAERPAIPEPDWLGNDIEGWLEILEATKLEERHRLATEEVTACLRDLLVAQDLYDVHSVVRTLIKAVEERHVAAYREAYDQVRYIEQTRRDQDYRGAVEAKLRTTVPGLVESVGATLNEAEWDGRLTDWEKAWRWAIVDNWLRKRTDFDYQQRRWRERQDTESKISALLAESAALRAWRHFFNRLSPPEAAALKGWREAVRAMGKATGRSERVERLRREARQYMDQCRDAIPIWIMPRYLVAEMVEPAPGRYDIVIVDEASQLGIESLFLFYISKKMVVVGDDQQISPYGVGIADESINGLQHHYLEGVPHQHALSAQSSLYANAKIRFVQNIVLREHFRCMPEIIQFSNDLCYANNGTPLDPLRSYPVNRLQPLVVRHVPDGYRKGSSQKTVNEAEADAILAQIVACVEDPRYENKTMGVISLQGDGQAKLIEYKLLECLGRVDGLRQIDSGDSGIRG